MIYKLKSIGIAILIICSLQAKGQNVVWTDIDNFWTAYDKIIQTKDSVTQYKLLEDLYLSKATEGLIAMRQVRNYTAKDYLDAINNYPNFWNSIRRNTLRASEFAKDFNSGIDQLRLLYPALKPAKIYFTIGAMRSNGTTLDNLVLIGAEMAMTDKNTISDELSPDFLRIGRRKYFDSNPINTLVLLNIHEYVHTQQKPWVDNLLSYVIREGVAEFVSVKAMNVPSAAPAIEFGKNNPVKVRAKFEQEMFYINNQSNWLWSDAPNEFGVRDLGYYIGYQMCENFYNQAENKSLAIKKMIELDYTNETDVEDFVEKSKFFSKPLNELYQDFEKKRPTVVGIKQFQNKSKNVNPNIKEITVQFSEPLNGYNTGVDFGELGQNAFPKNDVKKRFWSNENKSWTITVDLEPNKKYQLLITNNFRTRNGMPLKPYLIDFQTSK
ncbi:MAG: hypothetical protein ACOVQ4_20575 [Flectobacillus sp.]|uniref:hypothetical protein n=1 Tax=Flectobacillus sp. TaxID=50419 RepID=UPI003B9A7FF9